MKQLTPKQWMKKYCAKDYVICDGMTEPMGFTFNMLYPLFVATGFGVFLWVLLHWKVIKEKIKR